jgi:hypothetical protein
MGSFLLKNSAVNEKTQAVLNMKIAPKWPKISSKHLKENNSHATYPMDIIHEK